MFDFPKVRPVGKQKQNDPLGHHPQGDKNSLRPLILILGFFAIASAGVILFALFQKLGPEASAAPGIYKTLNYQGKLEDVDGITVADGSYNIKFTIHDAAAAGSVLWTARESDACGAPFNPSAKSVTTKLGVFSTQLGESGDCPINLNFNDDSYYLGVTVGADSEMTPRKRIGAAGYAFNADLLDGISEEYFGQLAQDETVTGFWTFNNNVDVNQHLALATNASVDSKIVLNADETYSGGPLNTEPNYYYGIYNKTTGQVNPGTCGGKPHPCSLSYYGLYNEITTNGSYGLASLTGLSNQVTLGGSDTVTNLYGMSIQVSQNSTTGSTSGSGLYVNIGEGGYGGTLDSAIGGQFYSVVATQNYGVWGSAQGDELTSVSSHGVYGYATGATSDNYGVYGYATGNTGTGYGGYFDTTRPGGYGVYGRAEDTSIANYGGYFRSEGAGGYGVYGWASDAGATGNYGGYFTAAGTGAGTVGVRGIASAVAAGSTHGVWGSTSSTNPVSSGVYGSADAAASVYGVAGAATDTGAAVANYGGHFLAYGGAGVGVYGEATYLTTATTNYGGYFKAAGTSFASGVYGEATGAGTVYGVSGTASNSGAVMNTGGFFRSSGTGAGASGVRGYAYGAANDVYGVYGQANSTGVYTNYGGYFLAQGTTGIAVRGEANNTAAAANYGGYFTAAGDDSIAVFGDATSAVGTANNIGGYFRANGGGNNVYGVYAVANGAGNNFGIYAGTTSATGWAGFFNGGRGIYAYRLAINDAVSAVAYNTIGTAAAGHTAAGEITDGSDLFIADDLEVDGQSWFDGGHVDLAEMVAYSGEGEAGDVVVVDENNDNSAKLATKPYDQSVLGIISTKPSLIITGDIKEGKLLAVAGRVPTKVTNANGAIKRGDLLTTSAVPGHAMKATEPGPIVGKAMGECDESECTIWIFLNVSWYGGVRTETTAAEVSPAIEDAKNLDRDNILDRITDFWKKLFQ